MSQKDLAQEAYKKELSKIEDYYIEKGGVGSTDFVAFEDALKNTVLLAQKAWFKKVPTLNICRDLSDSIAGSDEYAYQNIITRISDAKTQKDLHEKTYLNFSTLYASAKRKINNALRNSTGSKKPVIDGLSNPYLDLLMARINIVNRSKVASPKPL